MLGAREVSGIADLLHGKVMSAYLLFKKKKKKRF
jgi:hypothetical protein